LIAITSALINLGADMLLVPQLGEVGAAWGTFIAFACMLAATMVVVWRRRATE
jgi:Na+-driven multidrug efflux pump